MPPGGKKTGRPNRLIQERSPYLLQHAWNPVEWFPWGEEAFELARAEDKPLFVSIGYSTCHWCHVMERESFEDPGIADLLNETFVCIKVDREERPDIDQLYMSAAQVMTGSGGWPLTICMDADKIPFFAATYIPPATRQRMPGLRELVPRIAMLWKEERASLLRDGKEMLDVLSRQRENLEDREPGRATLDDAFRVLSQIYDPGFGGFGRAPKFPAPHTLIFLIRYWYRTGNRHAGQMVENTLDHMAAGGIHDQIGGGFHRYSTDARWLVPHFEKMLYDQALLAMVYTEAYMATGRADYRAVATSTLDYVLCEMTDPGGGFYSAEDADSEGEEGKYYLWTRDELELVLDPDEQLAVFSLYQVQKEGNFLDPLTGKKSGHNILYRKSSSGEDMLPGQAEEREVLVRARSKMLQVRSARVHPGKDDKILTDWNSLMIAALAGAARAFDAPHYLKAANRAAQFLLGHMRTPDGGLFHLFREGEAAVPGRGQDFAFLIYGLITLYQAGFESRYLGAAVGLEQYFTEHFRDAEAGGYFNSPDTGHDLPVRQKEFYDGAMPSCNSVACYLQLLLGRITGDPSYEQKRATIARLFAKGVQKHPHAYTFLLTALDHAIGPSMEIVLVGRPGEQGLAAMQSFIDHHYLPRLVVLLRPDDADAQDIITLAPFTAAMHRVDRKPAAYPCSGEACHAPVTRVVDLAAWCDQQSLRD